MALAMVAPARGGPAAGAVPAPDRRVLSVPGRGACGLRPHPPAAGGGPGQRCSLSTGCTGSPRRPRPSPQPGAACRGPRRPCAQVSDTGTSGCLSTYETAGGAVRIPTAAPSPAAPHCPVGCHSWLLRAHLLPSPPAVPRRSGRGSGLRQLSSTVSVPIGNVGARPGLTSQVWGLPASRAEATCSDGGAASELMTTRRQTSKRFSIFLPILPSGSR